MQSPSKNPYEKSISQYERKLARQRQLDLMEAAASGTAPSMQLDLETTSARIGSDETSLRSRNDSGRRSVVEEEEIVFNNATNRPKHLSSPSRSSKPKAKNLFEQRGRPDGLAATSGLNLMDHSTGVYKEYTASERMINSIRALFSTKKSSSTNIIHDIYDAEGHESEYGDYIGSARRPSKRRNSFVVLCKSTWGDRKGRMFIIAISAIIIFITLASISTVVFSNSSEKALREQNTVRLNDILDHVVANGVSHSSKFTDVTSPEYHALRWVSYSDPAKLPLEDPMLLTRYALATFFYNSYITFEQQAGRQKPIENGDQQWEGVPNPGWTRKDYWMTEKGVCLWYGVHCTYKMVPHPKTGEMQNVSQYDSNDPPVVISIKKNHIVGSLVPELKALVELKQLDLSGNKITGSIPTALGGLYKLETLYLPDNHLTGGLKAELCTMGSIKDIDLQNNALSGALPTELNRFYSIESLRLSHNNFTGEIPDLNACHQLKFLYLDHNKFSSDFPFSVALHGSLKEVYLNNNQIKGTIPGEIEAVQGLEKLRAESNLISGSLPTRIFARMSSLREIALENNLMTGQIPTELSALGQLQLLSLSANKFSGPIPSQLGEATSLQKLHLKQNAFTGTLPSTLGDLTALKEMWLQFNKFKGDIPAELSNCKLLETLYLENNLLSGEIPSTLGALKELKTFRTHYNKFGGSVPMEVCTLTTSHLKYLSSDCKTKVHCPRGCCNECH
jgi:Leucine-rich repeat (LRR) protein